ncbi:hypothetical protein [Oceanobacillus rekensis]|uniref:hypothetical protein n=1 Tax=Oceanobacillus rekensis TaxID=937927 RepID=UPI00111F5949|nr:hypothetical protein [Oceanobacillus rekensis]
MPTSISIPSRQYLNDLIEGRTCRLDIVVETKQKETDVVIIVHIEPQSTVQTDLIKFFPETAFIIKYIS